MFAPVYFHLVLNHDVKSHPHPWIHRWGFGGRFRCRSIGRPYLTFCWNPGLGVVILAGGCTHEKGCGRVANWVAELREEHWASAGLSGLKPIGTLCSRVQNCRWRIQNFEIPPTKKLRGSKSQFHFFCLSKVPNWWHHHGRTECRIWYQISTPADWFG